METAISLCIQGLVLEGRWAQQSGTHAAIVTHPHPLYGGDMDNSVVKSVAAAYAGLGWSTLRFNFRGTGNSSGAFDDGNGEQRDVQAAIDFLTARDYQRIDLAGYSFGAWVLAQWAARHPDHPHRLFLVAPPVAFIDFSQIGLIPGLNQVISGSLDDLAPPRQIDYLMAEWNPLARQTVIKGADHSFWGFLDLLEQTMAAAIQRRLPTAG
jgi:alpha/beta superfamily hydrolase